jgi:menaquinone-dependent protoporphyrinogen oxidase
METNLPGRKVKTYPVYTTIRSSVIVLCMVLLAVFPPSAAGGSSVLPDLTCGSANISGKRILVAYDSKHGSTAGVAEKIGALLCENGFRVDTRPALIVSDITAYDAIVIGSPMYYATFLPGVLSFLQRHKSVLAEKNVALFVMSTSVDKATGLVNENLLRLISSSVLSKFPEIKIMEPVGLLPGRFYFKEILPVEVVDFKQTGYEEKGDLINDALIRSWAETIAGLLK